jgi:hypothetical protein
VVRPAACSEAPSHCGVFPWFLLNKLMGATTFNPKLVHINDKFAVPISAAVERVISPPLGKNIILVARKCQ